MSPAETLTAFCVDMQRIADEAQAKIDADLRERGLNPEDFPPVTVGWTARRPGEPE